MVTSSSILHNTEAICTLLTITYKNSSPCAKNTKSEKYLLINQGFAGKQRLVPLFNRSNNEDLILAIQSAGVSRGRNGFRKDKSGEKLAESEEDLLEHRTDGTDAFDTLYIGAEKFPYHDTFSLSMSGVL